MAGRQSTPGLDFSPGRATSDNGIVFAQSPKLPRRFPRPPERRCPLIHALRVNIEAPTNRPRSDTILRIILTTVVVGCQPEGPKRRLRRCPDAELGRLRSRGGQEGVKRGSGGARAPLAPVSGCRVGLPEVERGSRGGQEGVNRGSPAAQAAPETLAGAAGTAWGVRRGSRGGQEGVTCRSSCSGDISRRCWYRLGSS
eukprot:1193391-Prorocentrum_minimum.AAC.2